MKKGTTAKMVRTIVYVFGPKRCHSDYMKGLPIRLEDGNWLKIGETHSQDETSDKLEKAMNRIRLETHTGIPYTCRLYDVFEYPYKNHTDDAIRKILAEDLFGLDTSKATNKNITDLYEIKAGREYVYGATRNQIKNALAVFERDLLHNHYGKSDFDTIMKYVTRNMAAFDIEDDEENGSGKSPLNGNVFWPKVMDALPDSIKPTHGDKKTYIQITSSKPGFKFAAGYRVRINDAFVGIETDGGEKAREKMNDLLKDNNILNLEERQGSRNPQKWAWSITTDLDKTEEELQAWFVDNITLIYNLLNPLLDNVSA